MLRILPTTPMRLFRSCLLLALLATGACSKKTVSFNSRPELVGQLAAADSLTTARDTTAAPSLDAKRVAMTKEQERAAKEKEKAAQRKPRKKKNIFLGERIKKAYVKSGPKGKNQVIETFYYLRTFQQPNQYAPARYIFDPKKRRIFKAAPGEIDGTQVKVLHGPYKKMQGGKVVETGFYAMGTRHLRWEKFTRDNILLSKTHYEMGFPRDANVTYYDAAQKQVKEVIPYVNGKLEGDYVRYNENGQLEWVGQFENGRRVGTWSRYWGFRNTRNRLRYEYEYGESGYEPEVAEPVLIKEYNRNGVAIFEKDKFDNRGKPDTARPGLR
ncbi:antitoxin component YwqK of YwqJK toxin-antitoxin module [Hymenobacter luteus]|uniref:Antitoxin component YwqK of YwqJK toxin-antitoxin module n=2 Tax=Hymenobacter TaxID=89966 RepID=A0A7W9T3W4_9BACT|nr:MULTISPECIES: hypothetical protein [Hymenobacter]MBB4602367.1 antitoxin component YwqK of YwqJK toxin-antitoxin module [Hymenobacter latericoloratus]MBB6060258.1 antitoxin component YwqK of YwqJK toxin-antitoxin module [Hymenobacter luteus]